jgi:hypothetical protein
VIEKLAVPLAVFWVIAGVASIVLLVHSLRSGKMMPRIFGPLISSVVLLEGIVQSEGLANSGFIVRSGVVFGFVTVILVGFVFFTLSFFGGTSPVVPTFQRQLFMGKRLFFWFFMFLFDLMVVAGMIAIPSMMGWVLIGIGGLLFVVSALGLLRAIGSLRVQQQA